MKIIIYAEKCKIGAKMKYVSLIHALNISCSLETCGDWHASSIQWKRPHILESDYSLWGDYGIEKNKIIPEHNQKYNVANHIFICNTKYNEKYCRKVMIINTRNIFLFLNNTGRKCKNIPVFV